MSKKKNYSSTRILIAVAIILAAIVLVSWGYFSYKNTAMDSPDTITLSTGTQTRFESLYIGLSSISDNSAWLSIHKDGEEGSTTKQVAAGDTINIYGYTIEIKSVNKSYNFSFMPGSSHGNVKFIINKQ